MAVPGGPGPQHPLLAYWAPSVELPEYQRLFARADTGRTGRIGGTEAVAFFKLSGLPPPVLHGVWELADWQRCGFLGFGEFCVALRLISLAQSGNPVSMQTYCQCAGYYFAPPKLYEAPAPAPAPAPMPAPPPPQPQPQPVVAAAAASPGSWGSPAGAYGTSPAAAPYGSPPPSAGYGPAAAAGVAAGPGGYGMPAHAGGYGAAAPGYGPATPGGYPQAQPGYGQGYGQQPQGGYYGAPGMAAPGPTAAGTYGAPGAYGAAAPPPPPSYGSATAGMAAYGSPTAPHGYPTATAAPHGYPVGPQGYPVAPTPAAPQGYPTATAAGTPQGYGVPQGYPPAGPQGYAVASGPQAYQAATGPAGYAPSSGPHGYASAAGPQAHPGAAMMGAAPAAPMQPGLMGQSPVQPMAPSSHPGPMGGYPTQAPPPSSSDEDSEWGEFSAGQVAPAPAPAVPPPAAVSRQMSQPQQSSGGIPFIAGPQSPRQPTHGGDHFVAPPSAVTRQVSQPLPAAHTHTVSPPAPAPAPVPAPSPAKPMSDLVGDMFSGAFGVSGSDLEPSPMPGTAMSSPAPAHAHTPSPASVPAPAAPAPMPAVVAAPAPPAYEPEDWNNFSLESPKPQVGPTTLAAAAQPQAPKHPVMVSPVASNDDPFDALIEPIPVTPMPDVAVGGLASIASVAPTALPSAAPADDTEEGWEEFHGASAGTAVAPVAAAPAIAASSPAPGFISAPPAPGFIAAPPAAGFIAAPPAAGFIVAPTMAAPPTPAAITAPAIAAPLTPTSQTQAQADDEWGTFEHASATTGSPSAKQVVQTDTPLSSQRPGVMSAIPGAEADLFNAFSVISTPSPQNDVHLTFGATQLSDGAHQHDSPRITQLAAAPDGDTEEGEWAAFSAAAGSVSGAGLDAALASSVPVIAPVAVLVAPPMDAPTSAAADDEEDWQEFAGAASVPQTLSSAPVASAFSVPAPIPASAEVAAEDEDEGFGDFAVAAAAVSTTAAVPAVVPPPAPVSAPAAPVVRDAFAFTGMGMDGDDDMGDFQSASVPSTPAMVSAPPAPAPAPAPAPVPAPVDIWSAFSELPGVDEQPLEAPMALGGMTATLGSMATTPVAPTSMGITPLAMPTATEPVPVLPRFTTPVDTSAAGLLEGEQFARLIQSTQRQEWKDRLQVAQQLKNDAMDNDQLELAIQYRDEIKNLKGKLEAPDAPFVPMSADIVGHLSAVGPIGAAALARIGAVAGLPNVSAPTLHDLLLQTARQSLPDAIKLQDRVLHTFHLAVALGPGGHHHGKLKQWLSLLAAARSDAARAAQAISGAGASAAKVKQALAASDKFTAFVAATCSLWVTCVRIQQTLECGGLLQSDAPEFRELHTQLEGVSSDLGLFSTRAGESAEPLASVLGHKWEATWCEEQTACALCLQNTDSKDADAVPVKAREASSAVHFAGHVYHAGCINLWLNRVSTTPPPSNDAGMFR